MENFCNADTTLGVIWFAVISVWDWLVRFVFAFWIGLQWPHAALAIFGVSIFTFRKEISDLILRIKSLGKDGLLTNPPRATQNQTDLESDAPVNAQGIANTEFPAVMEMTRGTVDFELASIAESEKSGFLYSNLAYWKTMWWFENVYSNIFGGQILLLRHLNQFGEVGISSGDIAILWAQYQDRFKPHVDSWSSEVFLNYLIDKLLIERTADGIRIKPIGTEFLVWMAKFGRSDSRPW
ncbi:hypothetical protein [Pseudomonas sp. PDM27]|uniref:hypothetical protein n=1 Tax=Pseudomonas sp. PDM27 TaxID=2854769 RepID=UPI001C463599|nr:hypothetical protein [Pseudomonas sp. PDM27]MBV7565592.1 hypothetical protein [Pseudomonas sp. PDM27]